MTGSLLLMIPDLTAVSIPMKILSPVIILGSMLDSNNLFMVSWASVLSLLSNPTNPNALMLNS